MKPGPAEAVRASVWGQALVLVGLAGLAITQPLLDLMGRNPEFFVAGRYSSSQIVHLGLLVALGPSVVVIAVLVLARCVGRTVGEVVHGVLVGGLGALFGNVVLRGVGADGTLLALVAALVGASLAVLLARGHAGQLLLRYLAAANVVFLAAFLFASPVSDLLFEKSDAHALGTVSVPEPRGPVVVIVFDELPMSTLMRTDGTINAERYPSFARLAARTTWFRNASSSNSHTERAVPDIMTGTRRDDRVLPTYTSMPRNLLALLGQGMPVERYESITDLCPRSVCSPQAGESLGRAAADSLIVFGHRVLPVGMRRDLPRIDEAWGSFGEEIDDGPAGIAPTPGAEGGADPLARWHATDLSERNPATQAGRLVESALAIDDRPSLHFVHVVLPHAPWFITPWSTRLMRPMPEWHDDDPGPLGEWSGLIRYQRHSLQTGAADVALGQVLDHLEQSDLWDDATVIVTADHGTNTIPPNVGREPAGDNEEEIYRVPLFVKAAGQEDASVVDDVAMTIDILPTLIDLLDIETDWTLEGHSLLDGSDPTVAPLVSPDLQALFDVVDRHAADFPHGWDWTALAAVGDHGALVGEPLADLQQGEPSRLAWVPNNEPDFAVVPDANGAAPQLVTGRVSGSGSSEPPSVLLVVNGTVAGVTGGYERHGEAWTFSALLGPYLEPTANDLQAYEVTGPPSAPVLHRLS